jgi:tRNA threonylcarbamoyladenosine biosynthesis protein TsaE
MNKTFRTRSGEETRIAGESFARLLKPGTIVCMHGPLGAGKTTFIQGAAAALGIKEPVTSPTFTIASEYEGEVPLYHIDAYRLGSTEEFELLGFEEYLYGNGITFIEWSEKVEDALPALLLHVTITIEPDGSRSILIASDTAE